MAQDGRRGWGNFPRKPEGRPGASYAADPKLKHPGARGGGPAVSMEAARSHGDERGANPGPARRVTARGYTQDDFIEGVTIQGASAMHALIQKGAATLSF
jgi:hypothetical protein